MKKNKQIAVLADTWHINKSLFAEDVEIKLPELEWKTASVGAGGEMDVPLPGLTDALQTDITIPQNGAELKEAMWTGQKEHQFRWIKKKLKTDGTTEEIVCSATIVGHAMNVPGDDLKVGEGAENTLSIATEKYYRYENGKCLFKYNKLTGSFCVYDSNGNAIEQGIKKANSLYL